MNKIINNKYRNFLFFIFSLSLPFQVIADDEIGLPVWDIGVGVGAVTQSYYTGTKQTRQTAFPVIFPTYRGKVIKSDDEGLRAQLIKNDRLTLNLSADLNLSIDSDDIDLREGLDDVGHLLEVGPSFELLLNQKENSELILSLPIRGAFEIDDDIESAGLTVSPNLFYKHRFQTSNSKWEFGARLGPQFATSRYNNVYYGVGDEFSTANRNAYKADSGYSGSQLQLTLNSKNNKREFLWFMRYDNISGATFDDSPLVETDDNFTVGIVYTYSLFKSKKLVSR